MMAAGGPCECAYVCVLCVWMGGCCAQCECAYLSKIVSKLECMTLCTFTLMSFPPLHHFLLYSEREGRVLTSLNSKKTGRLWNTV